MKRYCNCTSKNCSHTPQTIGDITIPSTYIQSGSPSPCRKSPSRSPRSYRKSPSRSLRSPSRSPSPCRKKKRKSKQACNEIMLNISKKLCNRNLRKKYARLILGKIKKKPKKCASKF